MLQIKDISIAKNYLNDEELKILNNIVSGYFDFAEIQAMRHNPMHMADYVEHLDNVLKTTGEKVLQGAGTISHAQAIEKATEEYRKYQVQNLSPVEEHKKYSEYEMDSIFIRQDPAGNIKPDKENSAEKIGGAAATIMILFKNLH